MKHLSSKKDKDTSFTTSRVFRNIILYVRIHNSLVRRGLIFLVIIASITVIVYNHNKKGRHRHSHRLRSSSLPSSLTTPPILSLYEPGNCQFTKIFTQVPLLRRWQISPTTHVLRFGLPNPEQSLQLPTCAALLFQGPRATDDDGEDETLVIRPYTPISTNTQIGSFDVLIKDYGGNTLSNYLTQSLEKGDSIAVSHGAFQVKLQASEFINNQYTTIGMIAGGTGITPMIQAAHAILGNPDSTTNIVLLYSSKVESDILAKELLDSWMKLYPHRLKVVYTLTQQPTWKGQRGRINQEMIEAFFPKSNNDDILIFICGPTSMYESLSGPRMDKKVGGVLAEMGYKQEQVYKF